MAGRGRGGVAGKFLNQEFNIPNPFHRATHTLGCILVGKKHLFNPCVCSLVSPAPLSDSRKKGARIMHEFEY